MVLICFSLMANGIEHFSPHQILFELETDVFQGVFVFAFVVFLWVGQVRIERDRKVNLEAIELV